MKAYDERERQNDRERMRGRMRKDVGREREREIERKMESVYPAVSFSHPLITLFSAVVQWWDEIIF